MPYPVASGSSDLPDYSSSPSACGITTPALHAHVGEEASSEHEPDIRLDQLKSPENHDAHMINAQSDESSRFGKNIMVPNPFEDVEDVFQYRPGGYHPVSIGDFLGPLRRFRVTHKLGYGYFGTVWLCYDQQEMLWRAVKILTADSSHPNCPELAAIECLSDTAPEQLMNNHLGVPVEHFWIDGPNGRHLCLVVPLLGPRIRGESNATAETANQLANLEDDNPDIYVDVSFQVTRALDFMHNRGLCHGDLRPMNILMQYDGVETMEESELMRLLGDPAEDQWMVWRGEGRKLDRYPEYLVSPANQSALSKFIIPKVAVVDFGLSYPATGGFAPKYGIPCNFSAPEMLFFGPKGAKGIPTDVWALACTITTIMTGDSPFCEYVRDAFEYLELILGPLPEPYRTEWKEHWDAILKRWGVEPPSEEYAQAHWNQDPLPGEAVAPIILSAKRLADKRERCTSGYRYKDVLQCQFSWEDHCVSKVENIITSNDIDKRRLSEVAEVARPQDCYSPKHEAHSSDQQSCQENEKWKPELSFDLSSPQEFRDMKDSRFENATIASKSGRESLPAFVIEQLRKQQAVEQRHNLNTTLESHDVPSGARENTDITAKSECSSSDYDSLLDVCEPTKPHWREKFDSYPEPILQHLQPNEEYKTWTDESGAIHTVTRMPHQEVLILTDLIRKMLRYDPEERINTAAVLQHEWFGDRGKGLEDQKTQAEARARREKVPRKRKAVKNAADTKVDQQGEPKPKLRRSARIVNLNRRAASKEE